MTDANYQRHLKVLGKLARLFDTAGADDTAMKALLATFVDQYATGGAASLPAIEVFPTFTARWAAAITAGAAALKKVAQDAATAYLRSDDFVNDMTVAPSNNTVAAVLAALQTQMNAANDNKKFTTKSSTGLVNFFDSLLAAPGTWNTIADASADYKDSVYVVDAIV